ncbi:MAG: hypothetical protein QOG64_2124 [Acidimicrobiaceae bacterium]|nr:hypothetical protein [Acidimicrobiaceae bacterium]
MLVAVAAMVTTSGACSLGNRQAMADRVIKAARLVETSAAAKATISVRAQVIKSHLPIAPGPPRITNGAAPDLPAVIDFRGGRAAVAVPGEDVAGAGILFDGSRVFERRDVKAPPLATGGASSNLAVLLTVAKGAAAALPAGAAVPAGAPAGAPAATPPPPPAPTTTTTAPPEAAGSKLRRAPRVQRRWLSFDYGSLPKDDSTKTAGSYAINPIVVTHLAVGTLTGSMKLIGPDTIDGAHTTHYRMNVSRDKAERHLPEKQQKELDKIFRANAIGGGVFPAEAWVDDAGSLRRFTVRLRQSLSRTDRADLDVTLQLAPSATPVEVPVPDAKETAVVQDLGQLVHGASGS